MQSSSLDSVIISSSPNGDNFFSPSDSDFLTGAVSNQNCETACHKNSSKAHPTHKVDTYVVSTLISLPITYIAHQLYHSNFISNLSHPSSLFDRVEKLEDGQWNLEIFGGGVALVLALQALSNIKKYFAIYH